MIVIKGLDNKVIKYIDTQDETYVSIALIIREYYQHTFKGHDRQICLGKRHNINLAPIVD